MLKIIQDIIDDKPFDASNGILHHGEGLEVVNSDYLYSELINPVFTQDGENVKVDVSVKYIDNQTKTMQISQYELTLQKGDNWKIIK